MNSYKRPLPKGSVIEYAGIQATVLLDKGLEMVVECNSEYGLWDWKLGSKEFKVISIPQIEPVTETVDDRFSIKLQDQKITLPLSILGSLVTNLTQMEQEVEQQKTVKMRYEVQGDDKKVVELGPMSDFEYIMFCVSKANAEPVDLKTVFGLDKPDFF